MLYKSTIDEKVLAEWALTKQKHKKGNGLIQRILLISIIFLVVIYMIFKIKYFFFYDISIGIYLNNIFDI